MNWGRKIALAYGGFVVFMVGLVYLCLQQKDIFLVTKEYYKEELAYQDKIDAMKNVHGLSAEVGIDYTPEGILVKFPDECLGATGQAVLYRPSDADKDVNIPFRLTASPALPIASADLDRGLWILKGDWKQNNKNYYLEQKLTL